MPEKLPINLYLDEGDLPPMSKLEGDEEPEAEKTIDERVKLNPRKRKYEGTGLKILTPNKLLTRIPILLAQIKAGNSSYKVRNEIRQIQYLLYQHIKINKSVYNNLIMEENMIVIKDPQIFCSNLDWPKYVVRN